MGATSSKAEEVVIQSSDDTRADKIPIGTDVTYRDTDILRQTDAVMQWDEIQPIIAREDLPVLSAYLLHNVLSPEECQRFIEISEDMIYSDSPLRDLSQTNSASARLSESTKQIRNSERVLFDVSDQIGVELNRRILPFLTEEFDCEGSLWRVQQLGQGMSGGPVNKRWRFNRYAKDQFFKPHFDAGFVYSRDEKTLFTFILYLSDDFEGGETTFFPGNRKLAHQQPIVGIEHPVKPKRGSCLIFPQAGALNPRHEGAPHRSEGKYKYILRSDIAYVKINDTGSS
ncbi:hypothetical protein PROFUN_02688 [Planoprotostelium fungivorum]|uniref:Fe2OG dioxygenase domain-containing protein n=1 Tax=Planoprotostelium fungivorum TaxID=1890364 RepID=A0A2P6NVF4_9EUKA|nr:hypothetical protein PROFUN_02688 [Planoprotostelium fungivorum]